MVIKVLAASRTFNRPSGAKTGTVHLTVLINLIALCVIGQLNKVKISSGRIVILIWCMTSLVLLAAYSAFLISSLAVQPRDLPFRDLQGLLHDGSYRLSVERNSYIFNLFDVRRTDYL
jgi:hypothetical protein